MTSWRVELTSDFNRHFELIAEREGRGIHMSLSYWLAAKCFSKIKAYSIIADDIIKSKVLATVNE